MTASAATTIVVAAAGAATARIDDTVRSVRAQTRPASRLIVVGGAVAERRGGGVEWLPDAHDAWRCAVDVAADDDWVAVVEAGDLLLPDALASLAPVLLGSGVDIVYTDERVVHGDGTLEEHLKPDWSPERARSHDYCGQLAMFRGRTLARLDTDGASSRHAVLLHAAARARRVAHVPGVLFERAGPLAPPTPRSHPVLERSASVVMPTAGASRRVWGVDRTLVLDAVDSVLQVTEPTPQVVVVVDPSTPAPVRSALAARPVVIVDGTSPFNFAAACNAGVAASDGDDVVLLNDDTLAEQPTWLMTMQSFFAEDDVGAVGARLLYADGTLQHGGVLLNGQPLHIFHGYSGADHGPFDLLRVNREVTAVTGACLVTPRARWDELGGLDPAFAIAGNDLDYCLRLRRAGHRIIWTPDATLYHFESQSRRADPTPADTSLIYERWRREIHADPYGNPNFEPRQAEWISRQPLGIEQRIWRGLRRTLGRPEPSDG